MENTENNSEALRYDHLSGAENLLRSINIAVKEDPSLLTLDVQNDIKVAEEALANALSKIHASKEALKIQEQANSKANFNIYFGDLNGLNFANMAELNTAIKERYIKLYKATNRGANNKIGISEFENDFTMNAAAVRDLDKKALVEINFSIGNVPYKLLLLGFRAYLSQPNHEHTIMLYRESSFTSNGKTYSEKRPYALTSSITTSPK